MQCQHPRFSSLAASITITLLEREQKGVQELGLLPSLREIWMELNILSFHLSKLWSLQTLWKWMGAWELSISPFSSVNLLSYIYMYIYVYITDIYNTYIWHFVYLYVCLQYLRIYWHISTKNHQLKVNHVTTKICVFFHGYSIPNWPFWIEKMTRLCGYRQICFVINVYSNLRSSEFGEISLWLERQDWLQYRTVELSKQPLEWYPQSMPLGILGWLAGWVWLLPLSLPSFQIQEGRKKWMSKHLLFSRPWPFAP